MTVAKSPGGVVPAEVAPEVPLLPNPDRPSARERVRAFTLAELRNARFEQQTRHYQDEHDARQRVLGNLSRLLSGWLAFVAALVLLQGFLSETTAVRFRLAERELIAVLGVTTVNVIGVFLVAARYVFPARPRWGDPPHPARRSA